MTALNDQFSKLAKVTSADKKVLTEDSKDMKTKYKWSLWMNQQKSPTSFRVISNQQINQGKIIQQLE